MRVAGIVGAVLLLVVAVGGLGLWLSRPIGESSVTPEVVIADVSSERLTRLGSTVGFAAADESHVWLGMPYAKPPVGELRWRPPEPPEPWTDTLDALAYGSACPQLANAMGGVSDVEPGTLSGSEDCLFLNVWAPRYEIDGVPKAAERRPVMFWIHGGGNTIGRAGPMYDGSKLAGTQDVVVVSLNYRIGPLGWFMHPALGAAATAGGAEAERSGNFGTLDLVAGLVWVRDNIEYFGGDPDNVTIFGESAGGTNVVSLLVSPNARGLFHRAIVQSGSTASFDVASASHYRDAPEPGHDFSSREVVLRLLLADGSGSDRESAKAFAEGLGSEPLAEYLRSKSPQEIFEAYLSEEGQQRITLPRVIRDGSVIPTEDPLELLGRRRGHHDVPIILGSNRDEIKLFFSQNPEFVVRYLGIFVRLRDEDRYHRLAKYHSDLWKVNGVDAPAESLLEADGAPVFGYRFDWDEEPVVLGADVAKIVGAGRGLEIPFVFGTWRLGSAVFERLVFSEQNAQGRHRLSDAMMSYWTEFAYTGVPGRGRAGDLPEWKPWAPAGEAGDTFVIFDTEAGGGIRMSRDMLTRQDVIDAVDRDVALPQSEKCRVFFNLFRYSSDWTEAWYQGLGAAGCRAHPSAHFEAEGQSS